MKVFISYAHADEVLAGNITRGLEKVGLEVWNSAREILPGDNWADKVAQALKDSEAMVVLLTPDALKSNWVQREIEFALGERAFKNRLIPVVVGDPSALPAEDIPWILRHQQMVRLPENGESEEGFNEIAQALLEVA